MVGVGPRGMGRSLDVVESASDVIGPPSQVVVARQVAPRRDVEWSGRVAREEPNPASGRELAGSSRQDDEQLPTGAFTTVDDMGTHEYPGSLSAA